MIRRLSLKKIAPHLIGLGLVLFVIHNPYQPFISYAFLPWIGLLMLVFGSLTILRDVTDWKQALGDKKVWIPLGVIALSITSSGIIAWMEGRESIQYAYGTLATAVFLVGVYLSTRQAEYRAIFAVWSYVVVIEAVSIVLWGAFNGWKPNGGLVSPTNYDIATGVIVFGVLVSPKDKQWWLGAIGAIGLLFSGSAEAIFLGIVMGVAIIKEHGWSLKLNTSLMAVVAVAVLMVGLGIMTKAQHPIVERLQTASVLNWSAPDMKALDKIIGYRLTHWQLTMPIKPLGYGYNMLKFYWGIPHNIILIIIEQSGILAVLAWLWIAYLGIKQKSTRLLWIGFVALGVFDHFIWTQAAPWMWAITGATIGKEVLNANVDG